VAPPGERTGKKMLRMKIGLDELLKTNGVGGGFTPPLGDVKSPLQQQTDPLPELSVCGLERCC
jgi:hypothetical protein